MWHLRYVPILGCMPKNVYNYLSHGSVWYVFGDLKTSLQAFYILTW